MIVWRYGGKNDDEDERDLEIEIEALNEGTQQHKIATNVNLWLD